MIELSKHFGDQWRRYFNCDPPSPVQVLRIIRRSVWLQKGQDLLTLRGEPFKLLSSYWHPGKAVVIKVDWKSRPPTAVTVITEKSKRGALHLRSGQDLEERADGA